MAVGNEVKYKNIPKKFDDDACFAAGTKILTRLGNVPIETISNGDDVWTPFGWSKVKNTGMTGVKNVIKFKDTWVTPNHKYFINGKFSPIDTIRYSDTMNVCEKPYTSMKYRLGDTQIRPIGLIGSISNALVTRSTEARLNFYTAQFGKKRGGIFQKVITYITQTVMLITTQSKIWFAYHLNNIISFIRIKTGKMDLLSQEKKQKYGINLKREESGIEKTGKSVGSTENVTQKTVKHVENNLRHFFQRGQSFVDLTAKCMPYEEEGELKRELKRKKSKEVPVYNLSVENGCYYADGFLVSNCDALRYFIYSYNLPTVDPNILDIPIYKPMNSKTGY